MGYLNHQLEKRAFPYYDLMSSLGAIAGATHGHLRSEEENTIPAALLGSAGAMAGAPTGFIVGGLDRRTRILLKKALPRKLRFAADLASKASPDVGMLGGVVLLEPKSGQH